MSNFLNTQQAYSTSGVNNVWLAPNVSWQTNRNSGGMTNVAGPVIVKAIFATPVSGFTGAGSSGALLIACHAVSGATSGGNVAGDVLYFHYGGGVAISGGVQTAQPQPLTGLDFIAKSGLSIFVANSGATYAYALTVVYGSPQV